MKVPNSCWRLFRRSHRDITTVIKSLWSFTGLKKFPKGLFRFPKVHVTFPRFMEYFNISKVWQLLDFVSSLLICELKISPMQLSLTMRLFRCSKGNSYHLNLVTISILYQCKFHWLGGYLDIAMEIYKLNIQSHLLSFFLVTICEMSATQVSLTRRIFRFRNGSFKLN